MSLDAFHHPAPFALAQLINTLFSKFAGSQAVFVAAEALCDAVQQAESLVHQCCETGASEGSIWPLEDAIEFQSVALELLNAVSGKSLYPDADIETYARMASGFTNNSTPHQTPPLCFYHCCQSFHLQMRFIPGMNVQHATFFFSPRFAVLATSEIPLPSDVREDIAHVRTQLQSLEFTQADMEESENTELEEVRQKTLTRQPSDPTLKEKLHQEQQLSAQGQTMLGSGNILPFGAANRMKPSAFSAAAAQQQYTPEGHEDEQHPTKSVAKPVPDISGQEQPPQFITDAPAVDDSDEDAWQDAAEEEAPEIEIPPPDHGLINALDKAGQVYVNMDNPGVTALPPGFQSKGVVGRGGSQSLPQDPFSLEKGDEGAVKHARMMATAGGMEPVREQ